MGQRRQGEGEKEARGTRKIAKTEMNEYNLLLLQR